MNEYNKNYKMTLELKLLISLVIISCTSSSADDNERQIKFTSLHT